MCLGHGVECLPPFVCEVEVCLFAVAAVCFSISTFVIQLHLRDVLERVEDTIHVLPLLGVSQGTDYFVCRTSHGGYRVSLTRRHQVKNGMIDIGRMIRNA